MKYNKKGESRIEISDILDYFKDINSMYNDCLRHDSLKRMLEDLVAETREDAELERKTGKWVHGKLIYSDISIATCTTCGKRVPVGNFCMDCGSYNSKKERRTDKSE
jgi:ribosomal protein L32